VTQLAPTRVVIDCDTGVDDAMAILYGLLSPAIEIVGLTCCWGNIWVETTTANTLRRLEIVQMPNIPVAMGARKPLLGPMWELCRPSAPPPCRAARCSGRALALRRRWSMARPAPE
jgi:inosine-uridine preferring nucleoside hydrolase